MSSQPLTLPELGLKLRAPGDIPALIGAAYGADALLLTDDDLGPEFLNLKTGLLGELFQKLTTYRLPTALVMPDPAAHGERFPELAREYARHPQVRFFTDETGARAWLARHGAVSTSAPPSSSA